MPDVSRSLRIEYDKLFYGIVKDTAGNDVPFYDKNISLGQNPELYVIYQGQTNIGRKTFQSLDFVSRIQFVIYHKTLSADSIEVDNIAEQIGQLVQPDAMNIMIAPLGFQVTTTTLSKDFDSSGIDSTNTAQNTGASKFIYERLLEYTHNIFDQTRLINY